MIDIWTIQMAKWRVAKQHNVFLLDTTAKSGNKNFAPTFENVMAYKNGFMTEDVYTEQYIGKMRLSLKNNPLDWYELRNNERLAIACYCPKDRFCHRHIFTDLLTKYFDFTNVAYRVNGELE